MDFNSINFLVIILIQFLDKISDIDLINISHPYSGIESDFKQLLDLFKSVIVNGCPAKDIPVLDPYQFKNYKETISGNILSYEIVIGEGKITGLSDFEMLEFTFNKFDLSSYMKIYFPLLRFHSENYDLAGNVFQIAPIGGRGFLNLEFNNLTVSSKMFFKQSVNEKSLLIDHLEESEFFIEDILARNEIDNNVNEIFNTLINEVLAQYLNRFNKYISAKYSTSIVDGINKLLNKLESWQLIEEYLLVDGHK